MGLGIPVTIWQESSIGAHIIIYGVIKALRFQLGSPIKVTEIRRFKHLQKY